MVVMIVLLPALPQLNSYSKNLMLLEDDKLKGCYSRIKIGFPRLLMFTFCTEDVVTVCAS